MKIHIHELAKKYYVKRLNEEDIEAIFDLYASNLIYFECVPLCFTKEPISLDLRALPLKKKNWWQF